MKTCLLTIVVMWFLVGIAPTVDGQSNEVAGWIFIYRSQSREEHQIHWIDLDTGIEDTIALPELWWFTSSPTRPMIAFTSTDQVYILDVSNRDLLNTGIIMSDNIDIIYGDHQHRSASLRWSPAGNEVAFIGYTEDGVVTVYVYEPDTEQLTYLTPNIDFREDFVDISSWSPDGRWLTVVGSWGENHNFRSALVARDGSAFIEFEPRTCEVRWSPNMHYLASATSCYESLHDASPLLLFTFDSTQPRIEQLPSLMGADTQTQFVQYVYPVWLNDSVLALNRRSVKRGVDLPPNSSEVDIVHFDVNLRQLTPVPNTLTDSSWHTMYGDWLLTRHDDGLIAYNMVDNRHEFVPTERLLPVSYSVVISPDDRFIALIDDVDTPGASHIRVINFTTHETLLDIAQQNHEDLSPIGFVPNGH